MSASVPASAPTGGISQRLALAAVACLVLTVAAADAIRRSHEELYAAFALVQGLAYLAAVLLVLRAQPSRRDLMLIIGVAIAMRLIAFAAPINLTTDTLRYVWDGRMQWAGFNPFLWVPAAPELAHLRDALYENINQKETAVTVYPPMAQLLFMAANVVSDTVWGPKIALALCDLALIWVGLRWLEGDGLPRERVIIYAWHPLPLWEFTSQAHIDATAALLLGLAILAAQRQRQGLAGAVLAAAVCTKYFPVLIGACLWRRWGWRMPAAFVAVAAVLYLPYAWSAGTGVIGFFGGLADNEGYRAGYGFHVIWWLRDFNLADPPGWMWILMSLVVLASACLWALFARGANELRPEHMVLLAALFVWLTSPHYPWYFAWIVPLLVRHLSPAAMAMTLTPPLFYLPLQVSGPMPLSLLYAIVFALPVLVMLIGCVIGLMAGPRAGHASASQVR